MLEKVKIVASEKAVLMGIVSPVIEKVTRSRDPLTGPGYLVSVTPLNPCQQNKPESIFVADEEISQRDWKVIKLHERKRRE